MKRKWRERAGYRKRSVIIKKHFDFLILIFGPIAGDEKYRVDCTYTIVRIFLSLLFQLPFMMLFLCVSDRTIAINLLSSHFIRTRSQYQEV